MNHSNALTSVQSFPLDAGLLRAVPLSLGSLTQLEQIAAQLVGSSGVDLAQNRVKRAMVCEALSRTHGNYTKAADLLGVRRQAIQHMVTRYELRGWAANIRGDAAR